MDGGYNGVWWWVASGNIQQLHSLSWMEQHSPLWLMLLHPGNVTTCYLHILLSKNIVKIYLSLMMSVH